MYKYLIWLTDLIGHALLTICSQKTEWDSAHGTLTTGNRTEVEAWRIKLPKINDVNCLSYLVKFEQKHRF